MRRRTIEPLDDSDLDGPDEAELRGEQGEYVPYLRARDVLTARLGATPSEIAIWTWYGRELKGKPAGGIDGYLDPRLHGGRPPRFRFDRDAAKDFNYLAQLVSCYYLEQEVRDFEPDERYITFERLMARFRNFCDEAEAVELIERKIETGELDAVHPLTGGTAESKGWPTEGFPPLERGVFLLSQVRGIEIECGCPLAKIRRSAIKAGSGQLIHQLEGSWDLPLAELQKELRQIVVKEFPPVTWDMLAGEQRRIRAGQCDARRDPVFQAELQRRWDEQIVNWQYWRERPTLTGLEFVALCHMCDPEKLDSTSETFPGGEEPNLGQRVRADLRRLGANVDEIKRRDLALAEWVRLAKASGVQCPDFMHADLEERAALTVAKQRGITPKKFKAKYADQVKGGTPFLENWFKGKKRDKGERPGAARFQIAHGLYDELGMVEELKAQGLFSELGFNRRKS